MVVDSSMRYSSGYTIVTIRGYGSGVINIPLGTTGFHYVLVGGGGKGDDGDGVVPSSTRGGGGAGGYVVQGTVEKSVIDLNFGYFPFYVGSGGGKLSTYLLDGGYTAIDMVYRPTHLDMARGGQCPSTISTGHGGGYSTAWTGYVSTYSTHLGGSDFQGCGGGGAGFSDDGSAAVADYGGAGGDGKQVTFFDYTTYVAGGGGGCGISGAGGPAGLGNDSFGAGHGGYSLHAPTAGMDGYGGGGGGGYIYEVISSGGGPPVGAPSSTEIGILGYGSSDPIGGGVGYSLIYTSSTMAAGSPWGGASTISFFVTTPAGFVTACANASSGDYIFIGRGTTVNMTGYDPQELRGGVKIVSNRGQTSTDLGGILKRTTNKNGGYCEEMITLTSDNNLFSGLQLIGESATDDHVGDGDVNYLVGIRNDYTNNLEVRNCEIYGWLCAGILAFYSSNTWVHHNNIHDNNGRGWGYGYQIVAGNLLFECNILENNRHSVTGSGYEGESYEARFNLISSGSTCIGACVFDVHEDELLGGHCGDYFTIHHNSYTTGKMGFTKATHVPDTGMYVENNLINCTVPDDGWPTPVSQYVPNGFGYSSEQKIYCANNVWLTTNYSTNSIVGIVMYNP